MTTLLRPMRGRDTREHHRASTPLELFFDLTFVVGVSFAAEGFAHEIAVGHGAHGLVTYLMVFFAIWWGWLNFTWFASAYDTDDWLYRVVTLVQMAGALVVAAGVPRALDDENFAVVVVGYLIMRLAMVFQWLRAARSDPARRAVALTYAAGITVVQALWVLRLLLPESLGVASFAVLVVAELAVPALAERHRTTSFHAGHIAERYGLFTLIVLGEGVLAAAKSVVAAIDEGEHVAELVVLAGLGLWSWPGCGGSTSRRSRPICSADRARRSSGGTGTTWSSPRRARCRPGSRCRSSTSPGTVRRPTSWPVSRSRSRWRCSSRSCGRWSSART